MLASLCHVWMSEMHTSGRACCSGCWAPPTGTAEYPRWSQEHMHGIQKPMPVCVCARVRARTCRNQRSIPCILMPWFHETGPLVSPLYRAAIIVAHSIPNFPMGTGDPNLHPSVSHKCSLIVSLPVFCYPEKVGMTGMDSPRPLWRKNKIHVYFNRTFQWQKHLFWD